VVFEAKDHRIKCCSEECKIMSKRNAEKKWREANKEKDVAAQKERGRRHYLKNRSAYLKRAGDQRYQYKVAADEREAYFRGQLEAIEWTADNREYIEYLVGEIEDESALRFRLEHAILADAIEFLETLDEQR
jgi:hypothetical protein